METHLVHQLTATFEGHAQQTETGVEYWLARDLQQLLGYAEQLQSDRYHQGQDRLRFLTWFPIILLTSTK